MSWRFLYEGVKNENNNRSADESQSLTKGSASTEAAGPIESDEGYQMKLFENDLYVWSLLLLGKDKL